MMIQHKGQHALSAFRRNKRLHSAQQQVATLTGLHAVYLHFIETDAALSATQQQILAQLLDYRAVADDNTLFPDNSSDYQQSLWVLPRAGTISPWSSKATDIAQQCGLTAVLRIERAMAWTLSARAPLSATDIEKIMPLLHDRMTETVLTDLSQAENLLFAHTAARPLTTVALHSQGKQAIQQANQGLGLALSDEDCDYLVNNFNQLKRDPTDVELMMFAQANSEHCRHKIFNADWLIDGQAQDNTLFGMIRHTYQQHPNKVTSAYHDNAAVMQGFTVSLFNVRPNGSNNQYQYQTVDAQILMKVETHNHPTAISPFAGAATGSGGEIRDEGATGRGSKPKAALTGFSVSHLHIPDFLQSWESDYGTPKRMASALDIMLEAPIGGAAFNNEFGRPTVCGYFRSFQLNVDGLERGYHKPIMLAGGCGTINPEHLNKQALPVGALLVVLGGPAMLIGLGGGAASSMHAGQSDETLDFASVQRGNPEMQRRCQEVIDACCRMGVANPIYALHDVGAGGLSNALPELLNDSGRGGRIELRCIPSADPRLSPMEIWCNEAQERYVLAIAQSRLSAFAAWCQRERCPYAVVGVVTEQRQLVLTDRLFNTTPIDMPLNVLLGKPPKMVRDVWSAQPKLQPLHLTGLCLHHAAMRVLTHPTVAAKHYLITLGDRSITGLVIRDQMVGPWQVPVADCAVTASGFQQNTGVAMSMGERAPLALINAPASGRMAIAEALTNLAGAPVAEMSDIVLSANWMAACGHAGEDAALFATVKAVGMELCPELGINIPVGKDSLSMRTSWRDGQQDKSVTAPLSLIVSAFARVQDINRCLTPQLQLEKGNVLLLIDLGRGRNRLGGSIFAQCHQQLGDNAPDLDDAADLRQFFLAIQALNRQGLILAYHDRSDGGLFACVLEMAFAGHCGMVLNLDRLAADPLAVLFNEELGAVLQVSKLHVDAVLDYFRQHTDLAEHVHIVGRATFDKRKTNHICLQQHGQTLLCMSRKELQRQWQATTYHMQRLRDNPDCADQEYDALLHKDAGLKLKADFAPTPFIGQTRPRLAVLREQGVNGQIEMAAAFDRAGFDCFDVPMHDIIHGTVSLADFQGFAAAGGFSYGDVLGAGGGWAKSIRFQPRAFDEFSAFFARKDSFALGVCNGCQMMAQLRDMIPGAESWPLFGRNHSEQFEARWTQVKVNKTPSLFFQGMEDAQLPLVVAHGEGRAVGQSHHAAHLLVGHLVVLQYIDNAGGVTETYPANPNGSPLGVTAVTTPDGRFTAMMPHPERIFLTNRLSYGERAWPHEESPWMQIFHNARRWLG